MSTLRLTQGSNGADIYEVEIRLDGEGQSPAAFKVRFRSPITEQDRENLRWYLEEYVMARFDDVARGIAKRVETRLYQLGGELFDAIFQSEDARDLWANLRPELSTTRIEIASEPGTIGFPWELLRDTRTDVLLALRARAFVRTLPNQAQPPKPPEPADGQIRILLVISRPAKSDASIFSSVARQLKLALDQYPNSYRLDVLRPATFARLKEALRDAHWRGEPYHIVHFDGHGKYQPADRAGSAGFQFGDSRPGPHGYLLFEHPTEETSQAIAGPPLGAVLAETEVPILVLNACRSARDETLAEPHDVDDDSEYDPHLNVRAYGSLAQEVMDAGVAGVVAMRYNVYVVTAAQFIADLYCDILEGQALGEAVTSGRKKLADDPGREIGGEPVELQDWLVPVAYENAPLRLLPPRSDSQIPHITISPAGAFPARGQIDPRLTKPPDTGFFGQDEALMALDRRFDTQRVVLLHARRGSGKSATVAEFARWFAATGGVDGPVLFTSFKEPGPLGQVLLDLELSFGAVFESKELLWKTIAKDQQRAIAIQLLQQMPLLWIWDCVEAITGFPTVDRATLNGEEQQELADFLRDLNSNTKCMVLLTSRRDERAWLGDLPARVPLRAMSMEERGLLARAIAVRHGRKLGRLTDWYPLLQVTQGNPATVTKVVGQALREDVHTQEEFENLITRLEQSSAEQDGEEC